MVPACKLQVTVQVTCSAQLPRLQADAAAAIAQHRPDIVVTGHSHKFLVETISTEGGQRQLCINPGSAGPARFKLGRTAALLTLPPKAGEGDA